MSSNEEKNKTKRIAKNTIVLYFRMLFLMLISLYTGRVILEALGVDDYGIYNVVGGFVAMFSLVSSSLTNASSRFLNYEMGKKNYDRVKVVFSSLVTIQIFLAVIVVILCEVFGTWYLNNVMVLPVERISAAKWCLQFSLINFALNLITVPYNAAIVAHEKMKTFAYVSIFEGIAKLLICYLIMWTSFDRLIFYGFLLLVIQIIVRVIYQVYCVRNFQECRFKFTFDKELLKTIFSYSGWHIVGNSATILKNHGVNLLLNLFFGPVVNAAKGISNQVLHSVHGFASNFMMAINPQITQSYAQGDFDYMFKLVYKGARFSFYVLFIVSLPIIINAEFLLKIWLKVVPEYAVVFARLTLLTALVSSLSNTLITAQNATGNVKYYQIIVGGTLLLNLPLSYLCLNMGFSPVSVMFVALIVEFLTLLARLFMIPRYISSFKAFGYLKNVILNCAIVVLLSVSLPLLMLYYLPENAFAAISNMVVCIAASIVFVFFVGCSADERKKVVSGIKGKINKVLKKK